MLITKPAQMAVWEKRLLSEDFAFDFETTEIEYGVKPSVLGVSLATSTDSCYLPIRGNETNSIKFLKSIMKSKYTKIAHYLQFEMSVCWQLGVDMCWPFGDTMVAAFNYDCDRHRYNLHDVSSYYGITPAVDFDELTGNKKDKRTMDSFSDEELARYSIPHAENTLELHKRISRCLKASGQWSSYWNIDMPCLPSVVWIEKNGVGVDVEQAEKLSDFMESKEKAIELEAYEIAGREFSLRPSNDLKKVLFQELRLPVNKVTGKTKQPSVDEETLKRLNHPIVDLILEHRNVQKLRSTFIDPLPEFAIDGRIYPRLHMTVARSGRFSSSSPNAQNIPRFDEYGIRNLFIPSEGCTFSVADYSQIEARLSGVFSGDPELCNIYKNNLDYHSRTCERLFGKVDPKLRKIAKTINFAVTYGQGVSALSAELNTSKKQAQEYLATYWSIYAGLKSYNKYWLKVCRNRGYTETLGGRRRILPKINSSDGFRRAADERVAINHQIQGTAAEVLKVAQTLIYERYKKTDVKLVLSVHDELALEVPKDMVEEVQKEQVEIMSELGGKIKFEIPLEVSCQTGHSWGDAH